MIFKPEKVYCKISDILLQLIDNNDFTKEILSDTIYLLNSIMFTCNGTQDLRIKLSNLNSQV